MIKATSGFRGYCILQLVWNDGHLDVTVDVTVGVTVDITMITCDIPVDVTC